MALQCIFQDGSRIGYTMEKCEICAYVTHEFAVFPEAREKTGKRVGYQGAYSTLFHGVTAGGVGQAYAH